VADPAGATSSVATRAVPKLSSDRPRVRWVDRGAVALEIDALLQSCDLMSEVALRGLVRGVSSRGEEGIIAAARNGLGVAKSGVSRRFVRASAADAKALAERRFDGGRFAGVMIDGVAHAGETMVVALRITEDGPKHILSLRQDATRMPSSARLGSRTWGTRPRHESADVLRAGRLDGCHAAVTRVWGLNAERGDRAVPAPPEEDRHGPRPQEARARAGTAALGGRLRDELPDGQGIAGGDREGAQPDPSGRGIELGGRGGDANGGAVGRAQRTAPDDGDGQPHRVRGQGDVPSHGARDRLAAAMATCGSGARQFGRGRRASSAA
jgi:hypothetical protein